MICRQPALDMSFTRSYWSCDRSTLAVAIIDHWLSRHRTSREHLSEMLVLKVPKCTKGCRKTYQKGTKDTKDTIVTKKVLHHGTNGFLWNQKGIHTMIYRSKNPTWPRTKMYEWQHVETIQQRCVDCIGGDRIQNECRY